MTEENLAGYRVWELDQNMVPKEIKICHLANNIFFTIGKLDIKNKTYDIRIGKEGLR